MSALAWVRLVGDDRFYYRSDGEHPIKDEYELSKVVKVLLRTLLNGLGYIPYVPVTDVGKKCPTCWSLAIGHDGYDWLRADTY